MTTIILGKDIDMYDSFSSDKASNTEEACWNCKKIDCTCDEDTMNAMDEEDRRREYEEREMENNNGN